MVFLLLGIGLFSCSKKKESDEILGINKFSFQTTSDFLLPKQKAYYFLTDKEGKILGEGSLQNGKTYNAKFQEGEELNFAYTIGTYKSQDDKKTFKGYQYLDVPTDEVITLHKYINEENIDSESPESKGRASIYFSCRSSRDGHRYNFISDHSYSSCMNILARRPSDCHINLLSQQEEIMVVHSNGSLDVKTEDFSYITKTVCVGESYLYDCTNPDFEKSAGMMKDVDLDITRIQELGHVGGTVRINAFPIDKEIKNIACKLFNPYEAYRLGCMDAEGIATNTNSVRMWYPSDWVENKREHIEMFVSFFTRTNTSTNTTTTSYVQKYEGNYPIPTDLKFAIPLYSLTVDQRGDTYTSTQTGDIYLTEIEYVNSLGNIYSKESYMWRVIFSAKNQTVSWKLPFFSDKSNAYLGIEYNTLDGIDMQPTNKYIQIRDGADYQDYQTYFKERFTPFNLFRYKDMNGWKTTTHIKEFTR